MSKEIENKVAIVTGASRGIGKQVAIQFGKLGISTVINYNSKRI